MNTYDIDHKMIIRSFQSVAWLARNLIPEISDKKIFHWIKRNQIPCKYWIPVREVAKKHHIKVRGTDAIRGQRITLELIAQTSQKPKTWKRG